MKPAPHGNIPPVQTKVLFLFLVFLCCVLLQLSLYLNCYLQFLVLHLSIWEGMHMLWCTCRDHVITCPIPFFFFHHMELRD